MTQVTCNSCGTANNTRDMGYCWKCKAPLPLSPPDALIIAFVQGAQYWEYISTGGTMWAEDRNQMEKVATCKLANGTLGKNAELPH